MATLEYKSVKKNFETFTAAMFQKDWELASVEKNTIYYAKAY